MNEIILQNKGGKILTSSRDVAEKFRKRNPDVNRVIENLIVQNCTVKNMFEKTTYISTRGREENEYLMDRDGFSLLVMGFTGKKALEWKLKYIDAFNKMEEKLKSSNIITDEEKLKLQLFSKDPAEVAYAHNKLVEIATAPLIAENEEFGQIREITINNEPWFVGKDVATSLGYGRGTKAIYDHVEPEDKDEIPIQDSIGRMQKTPIINESGLYALIFG